MIGRGLTMALMLVGLMGAVHGGVAAQDATPDANAAAIGVVDAGSRQLWNPNDATAPVYGLTVLQFSTADQARSAFTTITNASTGYLPATPEATAGVTALQRTGLSIADGATLYYQPGPNGGAGIATLFVLSGVFVHQWYAVPVPIAQNQLLVDPAVLQQDLTTLAQSWFATPHDGGAMAQLPTVGQLPSGYSVLTEQAGLAQTQPATATPGA